jgi:hypothetical protein
VKGVVTTANDNLASRAMGARTQINGDVIAATVVRNWNPVSGEIHRLHTVIWEACCQMIKIVFVHLGAVIPLPDFPMLERNLQGMKFKSKQNTSRAWLVAIVPSIALADRRGKF